MADGHSGQSNGSPRSSEPAVAAAVGVARTVDLGQDTSLPPSTTTATIGDEAPPSIDLPPNGFHGAFDAHHPPAQELIDDCVHCGFCLPTCPTYLLWGEEMDSPRGRIYLMKQGLQGEPLGDTMVRHFDQCLGCLACVTACPSGVQYGKLFESTRTQVERRHRRPLIERAVRIGIFQLFPRPGRLRLISGPLRLYQRSGLERLVRRSGILTAMPPGFIAMEALAPPLGKAIKVPPTTPAVGRRRATVGMLTGCMQRVFFPGVNAATARVLAAEGCDVVAPPKQGCCGALSLHMGREEEALGYARRLISTFERAKVDSVVVNAAGCGSTMKEYGYLLRDDPLYAERAKAFGAKVRDVAEIVEELGPVAPRHPLPTSVAYHDACHLAHGQGIRAQPRKLLRDIPGLEVRDIRESEICCGSAGVYNIVQPAPARELGDRKAGNVLATDARLLVTANPGCLLQISAALERRGVTLPTAHTVEMLDASIRGVPVEALLTRTGPAPV
jgi:glycolate oxidase iron-sulfur subunit